MNIFGRKKEAYQNIGTNSLGLFSECAKALQVTHNFTTLKPFTY